MSGPNSGEGGAFGSWSKDEQGLPCFDLAPLSALKDTVVPQNDPRKIWHQVGNDRLTATAHAGGWMGLYFADRGYVRTAGLDPENPKELGGLWSVLDTAGNRVLSPLDPDLRASARWGVGYARWEVEREGVKFSRRVWAPFGDIPALRVDVEISGVQVGFYAEDWGIAPYAVLMGGLMTRGEPAPEDHSPLEKILWSLMGVASSTSRAVTERLRKAYRNRLKIHTHYLGPLETILVHFAYGGPFKAKTPEEPGWFDSYPKPFFLSLLNGEAADPRMEEGGIGFRLPLAAGSGKFSFAVGSAEEKDLPALLASLREKSFEETARSWGKEFSAELPGTPALAREAKWNAYYLRSSKVRDDYFEANVTPQGSAYTYIHGAQGAPRDYVLCVAPQVFCDPAGARDNLRLVMRMTLPDGRIYYAHTGFGKCTWAGMHTAPSDLPLFLLWGLTEYVWGTGDSLFLDERVPFYPKERGKESTVRERVLLAWEYLHHGVRRGEHGLLRAGSGDWSDPISLMVKDQGAFRARGESLFNSAFAVWVLPRAADLIESTHPAKAREMRNFAEELRAAVERAWTGEWFLRGYDGLGEPLGESHLFLDANAWCLIARIGDEEKRQMLVKNIRKLLDDPSPIGATILNEPHPIRLGVLGRGWDCNGGVWAAVNGLLSWAYSLHDPALAWRSLEKQSLAAHARAYPKIWYGIWSGPDAYNAHYADRPGETFVHPATPMREFPVMNTNQHALPLFSLLRAAGVETSPEGIVVTPRKIIPGDWRIETPVLSVASKNGKITVVARSFEKDAALPRVTVRAAS
ncbi:MAG: hypothetical protein AB1405_08510 [Bdellovibrionota bacterium]